MAIVSCGALFDVLRQYHLLSEQKLKEVLSLIHGRCADVRLLAKTLIKRDWFTVFQMNQLLAGHGRDLAVGPYIVLDRLGRGGQSEVYKARHIENNWVVALKVIRAELLSTVESANQFLAEMEAMANLEHPNIVQFLDADKADDAYYCAMEFVEGTDLGKVVRLQGYLPPVQAAEYARQAAVGLQQAHEHNLVHRDIKPVNLFLTTEPGQPVPQLAYAGQPPPVQPPPQPLVKILDWGLASLQRPMTLAEQTQKAQQSTTVIGTADYLSPEQALNPLGVDIRSDIYSLGCTLYFLLTGRTPFTGTTVMQKVLHHQKTEPEPVEAINPDVPAGLARILRRMMAKKPAERFQTPAALAMALTPYCRGDLTRPFVARREAAQPPISHDDTPVPSGTMLPKVTARR